MKIGVFGGTFDPPHIGHLIVARDACDLLRLDRLLFVPARQPPHKLDQPVTPAAVRLELLRAALDGDHRFEICDLEIHRVGPSFTVDTLRELKLRHPRDELLLLLGVDQVRELETWREPEEIAKLARIVALRREGVADRAPDGAALSVTRVGVSSTDIRNRVAEGRSIRYLVPAAVEAIIAENGLYRAERPGRPGVLA